MTARTGTPRGSAPSYYPGRPAILWPTAVAPRPATHTSPRASSCRQQVPCSPPKETLGLIRHRAGIPRRQHARRRHAAPMRHTGCLITFRRPRGADPEIWNLRFRALAAWNSSMPATGVLIPVMLLVLSEGCGRSVTLGRRMVGSGAGVRVGRAGAVLVPDGG